MSVPCDSPLEVVLEDLDGGSHLSVMMDVNNLSYPLGVVPGMVVEMSRLEVRYSRKDGIYCQFTVSSAIKIMGTSPMDKPKTDR